MVYALIDEEQYDAALAELNKAPDASRPSEETLKLQADIQLAQKKNDGVPLALSRNASCRCSTGQMWPRLPRTSSGLPFENLLDSPRRCADRSSPLVQ